jgi:hypothetical protein
MPEIVDGNDEALRKKFDLQLSQSDKRVNHLSARLSETYGDRIEVKSERHIWETTGNLCIEYRHRGKPSGIAATDAEWWAHELIDSNERVVMTLMVPTDRLKALCRKLYKSGHYRKGMGDAGQSDFVLVPIRQLAWGLLGETTAHD